MLCMAMSIGNLEKRVFLKFTLQLNILMYVILYLVSCNVIYVVKEKSNTHIYTILSEHQKYEGFLR